MGRVRGREVGDRGGTAGGSVEATTTARSGCGDSSATKFSELKKGLGMVPMGGACVGNSGAVDRDSLELRPASNRSILGVILASLRIR